MLFKNHKQKMVKAILAIVVVLVLVGGGFSAYFILRGGDSTNPIEIIEFGGVEWRVLDRQDDKMLLLSEWIITHRAYHNEQQDITWEYSDIRYWLNNEFFNQFSSEEKAKIAETHVINDDNPWFYTPGGNDTADRVFLLSLEEVAKYFGDSGQLANRPDENTWSISDWPRYRYDKARVAYEPVTPRWRWMRSAKPKEWWLRSPGNNQSCAAKIFEIGEIHVYGISVSDLRGVRPAMWVYG